MVISKESDHDEPQITTPNLIHDQAKDVYCREASSAGVLPRSVNNYDRD